MGAGCPPGAPLPVLTAAFWSPSPLWDCSSQGQPAPCCSAGRQHARLLPHPIPHHSEPGPVPCRPDQRPHSLILTSVLRAHSSSAISTHLSLRMASSDHCVARSDITRLMYAQFSGAAATSPEGFPAQGALPNVGNRLGSAASPPPALPFADISSQMEIDMPGSHWAPPKRAGCGARVGVGP